ncbi:MAG: alpha/beta hydrolase, partial [Ktedonobacteraceae bacterium]|nr:alpha/beta hydrolase [Ktedonobacteraceae bacterium]
TILAPHLHGHGLSSHRSTYTTSYYREDVADIVALLDKLSLSRVFVVGFSDGAIVGLLLAALHPERVVAMAIHGAQHLITTRDTAAIRSWLLETPLSPRWQEQLTALHGDPYWRSLLPLYVRVQEELVAEGGILISDEELAAIRCPTLIMHGIHDRVVAVEYASMLAHHISGAQLRLFDAGHALHLRCADEYTSTVMNFFRNCIQPSDHFSE